MKRVAVIGAGVGGLVAALELVAAGMAVTVYEATESVGGKIRQAEVGGALVDCGPTVLTMRWVFEDLFADLGARFESYVKVSPLDILARHAFADGAVLDLHADEARSEDEVHRVLGAKAREEYRAYRRYASEILAVAERPFIYAEKPSMGGLLGRVLDAGLFSMSRVDAHRTMWKALGEKISDPRLRMLYARYATYVGASPFECPATLNLVSAVEAKGVATVDGGMGGLARGLERLARELGVRIVTGARVQRIDLRGGKVAGLTVLKGGAIEAVACSAVVANGDVAAIAAGDFGAEARGDLDVVAADDRSFSAFTLALVGRADGVETVHHNVFFADDYEREMLELTRDRRVPSRPSVYVCDQGSASAGEAKKYFVIVNAAANGDEPHVWTREEIDRCTKATFETMSRAGFSLSADATVTTTPVDFEARFPRTGGALYGRRPKGAFSFFQREGARSKKVPGLYFAGGSVHPGPGVPMAATSGRFAARAVIEDLGSTRRSRPGATSGSTSTR